MPGGSNPEAGPLTRELAALFRMEQARLDISQTQLAEAAGLTQSTVSRIMRGRRSAFVEEVEALCRALGLDIAETLRTAVEMSRRGGPQIYQRGRDQNVTV